MRRWIILFFSIIISLNVQASTNLTSWNENGIQQWEPKVFSGESVYTPRQYKGRSALQANSHHSASGLVLKKKIDLTVTPYINWSWLIEKKLLQLDELSRNGDDFAARIYVVIDGGLLVWKTKSLNYVWSSNQAKALIWNNAFAGDSVKMMSVRGIKSQKGQWYDEKRNVYEDMILAFGDKGSEEENRKAYQYIHIIAIMTDTDNSKKVAESYYGDITFSAM